MRLVATKDLRTFFRDPTQWSQLTILFGLLVLYLTNMPTLRLQLSASGFLLMIPFLNLCAVALILATFTCRFVFPLMSLEGQKLWLMGVLPIPRHRLLLAKLAFAMCVTLAVALAAMIVAAILLRLDIVWTMIHLVVTIAICFGLCGFAVGIGARMPMFTQTNAARIANGLGGTTNLLASIALVSLSLTCVGIATWRSRYLAPNQWPEWPTLAYCAAAVLISLAGGAIAMCIGARHLNRIDV
jgi:ABC-2 type transport system permease protein